MKICLVVGAGASLANAEHFRPERMQDTHPPLDVTFFRTLRVRNVQLTPALRSYTTRLLGQDPRPALLDQIRMEDFFKDLYFDFQESPADEGLRSAYTDLIDLYARIIRETTNWLCEDGRVGAPLGRLIAAAADVADEVSIITFNHDLVIENELERRARLRGRWCLEQGYGTLSEALQPLRRNPPTFPAHGDRCDHSRPIRVLKLHGSLNWYVWMRGERPTARMLSGQGGERELLLSRAKQANPRGIGRRPSARGGRTRWYMWPVIIPPVYAKQTLRRAILPAWDDAAAAIREAARVVFFGYSLPQLDVEAEKLFERGVAANRDLRWLDVVNPSPGAAHRYASLGPAMPVRWYPTLNHFLDEDPP